MSSSNPLCPECQVELEDDFGIVDCKSCGAICSVGLDGSVQIQGEIETPTEEFQVESSEEGLKKDFKEDFEEAASINLEEGEGSELETFIEESLPLEEPAAREATAEADVAVPQVEESQGESLGVPLDGAEFLKDLEVFTEESTAEDSDHTYYDLSVSGMGSSEERQILIETLADSRLEISEEFLEDLIGGEDSFVLKQVSFLRLAVIYKRLAPLGLKVSWVLSDEQQPRLQEENLEDGEYSEKSLDGEYLEEEYVEEDPL